MTSDWRDYAADPTGPEKQPSGPDGPGHSPRRRPAPLPGQNHWTVTSSSSLPPTTTVGGTRALMALCLLAIFAALITSGRLSRWISDLTVSLVMSSLPLLIVLVLLMVFLPRLGSVITAIIAGALRLVLSAVGVTVNTGIRTATGRGPESQPVTSLICRRPGGRQTEVRISQICNIPTGSHITVFGPTMMGRRHAWYVRDHTHQQVVIARGIVPGLLIILLTAWALLAIYT